MSERLVGLLPWAFSAGAIATLNPCGFALLPAYLAYFVGEPAGAAGSRAEGLRGALVGLGMTAGTLTVFLAAGVVVSAVGVTLARYLPWLGLVIGGLVALTGVAMVVRPALQVGLRLPNPAARQLAAGRLGGARAYYLFGVGYGLASLGCTLPIFLVVMTQALAVGGFGPGLVVFATYGLGMGLVLLALAVAVGVGRGMLVRSLRAVVPYVRWAGAAGMVAAGAYLIYYQLTVSRAVLRGGL
ncbi:MAG: cytochrome c biogenesis protein CcdA [Firmicutes bacterium]|nr:cytochrome c biogenesis protein CcdA [Bacillota bacterium]